MIDKLSIGWSSHWQLELDQSAETLMRSLIGGQNLRNHRVSRGYRWVRSRHRNAIELRAAGRLHGHLIAVVRLAQYPDPDTRLLGITGELVVNPTRLLARIGDEQLERWFALARVPEVPPPHDPHDNYLPATMLAATRPDYHWVNAAAEVADRSMALVRTALFGPGDTPTLEKFIKQVECYWEFGADDAIDAVNCVANVFRAGAHSTEREWAVSDDFALPTFSTPLGMTPAKSKHRLAIYPRAPRVRVEVRYLGAVGRAAPGAGRGTTEERLVAVAQSAAKHVNRALLATSRYRGRLRIQSGTAGVVDFVNGLVLAFPGDQARQQAVGQALLRNRYLRAGVSGLCEITSNEAGRLQTRGILARAPLRPRDAKGTVMAIHPRFSELPRETRL